MCIAAAAGLIAVFMWYSQSSLIGLQGTATIGQWSLAWVVEFVFFLILWEILIVGLPFLAIGGIGFLVWWTHLPEEEKQELKSYDKGHKKDTTKKASGGTLAINIAYLIYIAIQGNYGTPFGDLPWSYWAYSYILTILWLALIAGVPIAIGGILYVKYAKK